MYTNYFQLSLFLNWTHLYWNRRVDISGSGMARSDRVREPGGWSGSPEKRGSRFVAIERAHHHRHHGPSTCSPCSSPPPSPCPPPPPRIHRCAPVPLYEQRHSPSPSLACKNFSLVHEIARSTVVFVRCHSARIVTRRRDAPVLRTQMRHLRRTLSRKGVPGSRLFFFRFSFFYFFILFFYDHLTLVGAPLRGIAQLHRIDICAFARVYSCALPRTVNRIVNRSYFGWRYRNTGVLLEDPWD